MLIDHRSKSSSNYVRSILQRLSLSGISNPEKDKPGNMNILSLSAPLCATSPLMGPL